MTTPPKPTWLRWAKEDDPLYRQGWSASIVPPSNDGSKTPSNDTSQTPSRPSALQKPGDPPLLEQAGRRYLHQLKEQDELLKAVEVADPARLVHDAPTPTTTVKRPARKARQRRQRKGR
jgi:hypothetical protein